MNTFHYSALIRYARQSLVTAMCSVALIACSSEPAPGLAAASSAQSTPSDLSQTPGEPSPSVDLSNDALSPPGEPLLKIEAMPGELVLSWAANEDTQAVSIYRYDASKGSERKLDIAIDPASTQLYLPSKTHLRAWHREQFRVELCTDTDCVSSRRVAIMGLAAKTLAHLKPGVLIKNERYGEDFALNENASVLAISRPLEGSVDIHIKPDNQWVLTQRLHLSNLSVSSTRELHLALSGAGDVMAVLISDPSTPGSFEIRMLERLGEAWIETQQLLATSNDDALTNEVTLQLSALGDRLLLSVNNTISLFVDGSAGWQSSEHSVSMRLLAVSGSASLHRLFTLHEKAQQLWMIPWQESSNGNEPRVWIPSTPLLVNGLEATDDISLRSDDLGDRIVIAGWEQAGLAARTPVMWRYNVHEADSTMSGLDSTPTHTLGVIDSLRLAPTLHTQANLRFTSDSNLATVAIGWQSGESTATGHLQDAQLLSYRYHTPTRQWLTALELPEAIPTLAKNAFAGKVEISPDGSSLVLGLNSGLVQQPESISNEVLVLH